MGRDDWRQLLCPKCHQLKTTCTCTSEALAPGKSAVVRVGRETKGRGGKGVSGTNLKETDQVAETLTASTHSDIFFFTKLRDRAANPYFHLISVTFTLKDLSPFTPATFIFTIASSPFTVIFFNLILSLG